MEYRVPLSPACEPDVERIARALQGFDPAAVVDFHAGSGQLRIEAGLSGRAIADLLVALGLPVTTAQVQAQPSVCCGGCGG